MAVEACPEAWAGVGTRAPDFELRDQHGQIVRLADFRGAKNVVLVFFPFAFTPTCTSELTALRAGRGSLASSQVQLLAVSCDPVASLRAFADQEELEYPLLSDFWPHGAVSRAYGVFLADLGFATRGTFLLDRVGIVRWRVVNGPGEARDPAAYQRALAELG